MYTFDEDIEWWKQPSEEEMIMEELDTLRSRRYELEQQVEMWKKMKKDLRKKCAYDK